MTEPQRDEHGRFVGGGTPKPGEVPFQEIGIDDAKGLTNGIVSQDKVLLAAGLDPAEWEITNYRVSTYEVGDSPKTATRWSARRRLVPLAEQLDTSDLLASVESWGTPASPRRVHGTEDALAVFLSDWQVGGTGPGGGTRDTIARVLALGEALNDRARALRDEGKSVDTLHVFGLGDIVEGCTGFYASQAFSVDIDNMEQIKVAYHLLAALLRQWAPTFSRIYVHAIGGNHGETRVDGKSVTGTGDNKDVLVFEIVRDILAERSGFEHIRFHVPDAGELSAVANVAGVKVGYTHGHLFRSGANAAARAEKWWTGQMMGMREVRDANLLVSAHYHHLSMQEFAEAGRTWFQTPAMDNGSAWYTDMSGMSSAPGTLTLRIGRSCGPRLWDDLKVL